jgi:hypothetical protein
MSYTNEHTILQTLSTSQGTGQDVSVNELIALTAQYPAFGAAKYLLAKKAQQQKHEEFKKFAQDAVIYFAEPFWFHFKLNEETYFPEETLTTQNILHLNNGAPQGDAAPAVAEEAAAETAIAEEALATAPVYEETTVADEQQPLEEVSIAEEALVLPPAEEETALLQEQAEEETVVAEEALLPPAEEEVVVPEEQQPAEETLILPPAEEETAIPQEQQEEEIIIAEEALILPPAEEETDVQEEPQPAEEIIVAEETLILPPAEEETTATEEVATTQPTARPALPAEEFKPKLPVFTAEDAPDEDGEGFEDADAEREATQPLPANNRLSSMLQEQLADFNKPVAADTPVPVENEPYHTIDYFASQGIKLSQELQSQDHISVKVKKFTDWLKQMKRINPQPADLGIDEEAEHKVLHSAASSNKPEEVLTEAMAEVFAKQGLNDKAIELYQKLSFLNPSKSAYFAGQIEQLKEK